VGLLFRGFGDVEFAKCIYEIFAETCPSITEKICEDEYCRFVAFPLNIAIQCGLKCSEVEYFAMVWPVLFSVAENELWLRICFFILGSERIKLSGIYLLEIVLR
jgi:hypothetical protein